MKITYNLISNDDIEGILEINKLSFSSPWSKSSLENELTNPLAKYIVAKEDFSGKILGYVGIWIIAGEGDITNIAVHPDFRGHKIGDNLMHKLLDLCYELNCNIINLEVRSSNIVAQNLYKKFNFSEIAIRKKYYQDNGEDAIIMQFCRN